MTLFSSTGRASGLRRRRRWQAGVTLTELMIAVAVLSIGILGSFAAFSSIQRGIQLAKNKTLASNLAQEKMQILKQKEYYQVLVTTAPAFDASFSPSVPYDTSYFPPESILEAGVTYTRLTYIQVATEDSGALVTLPPTTTDTGMRLITVTVVWREGSEKKHLSVTSVLANPDTVMSNSIFSGTVKDQSNNAISGALVTVAENLGWRDSTSATGAYQIGVSPGNYTVVASAPGYFSSYVYQSVAANAVTSYNFALQKMSSGTISGTAWINPNVVISQVVASTTQASGYAAQYIELFNPTASAVTVPGGLQLNSQSTCGTPHTCQNISLTYVNNTIASQGYYVIANTPTFTADGRVVTADAYYSDTADAGCSGGLSSSLWNPPFKKLIVQPGHNGSVWLTDSSGSVLDAVGWSHNGNVPPLYETSYLNLGASGLADGVQAVRSSSPTFYSDTYGRAYDSGNNSVDLTTTTIAYRAYGTADGTETLVAGVPAVGAVASADDGLSDPVSAVSVGSPPRATFALTNVATGTWTVLISSGLFTLENDTVTIAATGSNYIFPSSTTLLNQSTVQGFISGHVYNATLHPISSPQAISVSPGGSGNPQNASTTNGLYLLRVSTGYVTVTANPNNGNSQYVSMSSASVPVQLGQVTNGVDFILSQGGKIQAFVTRDGVNALPGIAVAALDYNDYAQDTPVSDTNGKILTRSVSTGTYELTPVIDSLESAYPTSISVAVTQGSTVFAGTFTITGAQGTITGSVKAVGATIATGVLIVATTATLSGTPPAVPSLSTASLTGAPYYVTSSKEDGTYSLDVRGSTNPAYRVYGYYPTLSPTGAVTISYQTLTGVGVTAGTTTSGKDFSW